MKKKMKTKKKLRLLVACEMAVKVVVGVFVFVCCCTSGVNGDTKMPTLKDDQKRAKNSTAKETDHIKRLLAFGNSLTEGFIDGGRSFYPYSTLLEEKLNEGFNLARFNVMNEGLSGECVNPGMLMRLPHVLKRHADRLDAAIILGGSNDIFKDDCVKDLPLGETISELHNMVQLKGIKTVAMTIPERGDLSKKGERERVEANHVIEAYAKKHSNMTVFLDLARELPMRSLSGFIRDVYWDDQVHPSKEGYRKMAELVFEALVKLYDAM